MESALSAEASEIIEQFTNAFREKNPELLSENDSFRYFLSDLFREHMNNIRKLKCPEYIGVLFDPKQSTFNTEAYIATYIDYASYKSSPPSSQKIGDNDNNQSKNKLSVRAQNKIIAQWINKQFKSYSFSRSTTTSDATN